MRTIAIQLLKRILVLAIAAAMSACGSRPPLPLSLTYAPDPSAAAVPTAERVHVEVTVNDKRPNRDIEIKHGWNGVLLGNPFVNSNDLPSLISSAVQAELRDRGFELSPGNALVAIDLKEIEAKIDNPFFQPGLRPIFFVRAMVIMKAEVARSSSQILYSKGIDGKNVLTVQKGETLSSGLQRALNYAIDDGVRNLMADREFIDALLSTVKPAAVIQSLPTSATPVPSP